jgi:hypothetical protein
VDGVACTFLKCQSLFLETGFKDKVEAQDWTNEHNARHSLTQGLSGLDDDDIVLLTDADEIPNYDAIMFYRHYTGTGRERKRCHLK